MFFKILMVGYLNNINSDRALMRLCSNCLDVRLFLGYDVNENLPFHSTISRTRALFGEYLFLELFRKVLNLCVKKNMVHGKSMAVDAAFIKANASMDSLVEKEVLEDASAFVNELEENNQRYRQNGQLYRKIQELERSGNHEDKKIIEIT